MKKSGVIYALLLATACGKPPAPPAPEPASTEAILAAWHAQTEEEFRKLLDDPTLADDARIRLIGIRDCQLRADATFHKLLDNPKLSTDNRILLVAEHDEMSVLLRFDARYNTREAPRFLDEVERRAERTVAALQREKEREEHAQQ